MSQLKVSPKIPPQHRKALKDFVQNPFVAARVVAGDFDHLLPPEVKEQLVKDRVANPGLMTLARDRIERGIKAGAPNLPPDAGWQARKVEIQKETFERKAARKAKYGQ